MMADQAETSNARGTASSRPLEHHDRGYDVFLNFRGPDSRHTVADVLHNTLIRSGFRVFLDDEGIRKGEAIGGELLWAITNSRIYITIFSKGYASSKWCLRELQKMVECRRNSSGSKMNKVILPIFCDINVSEDLKLRSNVYKTDLEEYKKSLGDATVEPWEAALKEVATIKGWNLTDHGLFQLADLVKEEVLRILDASEAAPDVPEHLVGIHDRIEDIMQLLDEGSHHVRFIVIHGMGGIGKTTLANCVFKKISSRFDGSCILSDIRKSSSVDEKVKLQEKLLSDTLNLKFTKIPNINEGIFMIGKRLHDKKVLIILDDVDKMDHLKSLANTYDWFGPQSRIIITTRNIDFLPTEDSKEYFFYEMKEMDRGHALQLFCRHAFKNGSLPPEYYDISIEIIATTGGLPLAIEVIGSSLCNQDVEVWKFRLEKLKKVPHEDVREILMISYQALEHEQQQIFLDIACFFNGKKKNDPSYFWEGCRLSPTVSIKILICRSLIKVNDHEKLWMHDQLRDLGRAIAQNFKGRISIEPTRLWSPEVALDAIRRKEVDKSVVALELGALNASCSFVRKEFARSINLKFLQLQGGNFEGNFKNVLQDIRWLSWCKCPLEIEAINLSFKNLVVLTLSGSQITNDWRGWDSIMVAKQLKVLNLIGCTHLMKTPDFSTFLWLERLTLKDCWHLEEIDNSITKLEHLDYLKISNGHWMFGNQVEYSSLPGAYLPEIPPQQRLLSDSISGLKSLTVLKINNAGLTRLHCSIGELVELKHLCLRCPQLRCLPHSIGKLILLVELDISFSGVEGLPESIGGLKWLKILRMNCCAISYLPDSIGGLESLNELQLRKARVCVLPETIGNLKRLKVMDLTCSKIRELPKALGDVENLEELYASACGFLHDKLPEEIGKLSHLRILNLSDNPSIKLPTSINQLSNLEELVVGCISRPNLLPELPTSLTKLQIVAKELEGVPNFSHLTNLVTLALTEFQVYALSYEPELEGVGEYDATHRIEYWLPRLAKLEKLILVFSNLTFTSIDLSSLSRLKVLWIRCPDPQLLTRLPSSLESLRIEGVSSPSTWQLFSGLNNLSTLTLHDCSYGEIEVDRLGQLKNLHLHTLVLEICGFVKISNLSCLKELRKLKIHLCTELVDIQGLGEVESLRSLSIIVCDSIRQLPDLSRLKKLGELKFYCCESLERIPDVDEKAPCYIEVRECGHCRDFEGPYTELQRTM